MSTAISMPFSPGVAARPSRRATTRRDVLIPCQAVRERDFKLIANYALDVSVEGMLLRTQGERILTGEAIIVSFPIPGMWIDAEAFVTRVVHNRRPGDEGPAVGILFDVISPASRAALAAHLHGRPPPLPRRGPLSRLRRGEEAPQLADASVMTQLFVGSPAEVDDEKTPASSDEGAFGLGVLRALATAWTNLVVP